MDRRNTLGPNAEPHLRMRRLGAQLVSAALSDNLDVLYLSPLSSETAPARGGVPVLFPQFADRGILPKHGFARTALWKLAQEVESNQAHSIAFELAIASGQFADWPHAAHLLMQTDASQNGLRLSLQITNTGSNALTWTGGLHPYFAVDDLQACSVAGLTGLPVQDRYNAFLTTEPDSPPGWGHQPFERLYDACSPLKLFTGSRWLTLTANGFDQWMVWNPGPGGSQALSDLPAEDWQRFVCIEPVCVSRPVLLLPGEIFTGTLNVSLLPITLTIEENT